MEMLLLIIYSTVAWLVFFKFKLLPWNLTSQVITVTLPLIGMAATILLLNLAAPSSSDVRVINYTVQIVPQVAGRVLEVPVHPNQPVKKGDVLFRIDPTQYQLAVDTLEAKRAEFEAKLASAQAFQRELEEQLAGARGQSASLNAQLALATKRQSQTRELAEAGAGPRYDFEQAETDLLKVQSSLESTQATVRQVEQRLSARTAIGELAEIALARSGLAQLEAQLAQARWLLAQTTVYAPADGTVANLNLRHVAYTVAMPLAAAMTFVENEQWLLAFFGQNELRHVKPGQAAEVALRTHPNRVIKCKVDSVIWASGQGQLPLAGMVPDDPKAPSRFAVRLLLDYRDTELFLAAGARGQRAIYADWLEFLHVMRKVILRVGTKLDWLVVKLH
jgi:multidrug resistance efflux pump